MIKLSDILDELSLYKGDSSRESSINLFISIVHSFLPNKTEYYFKVNNNYEDVLNENIPVSKFIKDISKYIVSEKGSNKLIVKKETGELYCILINADAPSLDLVVIGSINLQMFDEFSRKFKFPKTYHVSRSVVANEYLRADFGKLLYFLTYNYLDSQGIIMASDKTLFSGSFRMWTKFMPTIAPYFGIILSSLVFPISKEDLEKVDKSTSEDIDGFVAMKKYPPVMEKINKAVRNLSFVNGEYAYADLEVYHRASSKDRLFEDGDNFFEAIEYSNQKKLSLKNFVKYIERELGEKMLLAGKNYNNIKCVVFNFTDGIFVVREQNGKLVYSLV